MTLRNTVGVLILLAALVGAWVLLPRSEPSPTLTPALVQSKARVDTAKAARDTAKTATQAAQKRARRVQTESRTADLSDPTSVKTVISNLDSAITDLDVTVTVERERSDSVIAKLSRLQDSTELRVTQVQREERKRTLKAVVLTGAGAVLGAVVGAPIDASALGAVLGAIGGALLGLFR